MAKLTLSNVANISGAESAAIGVINANSDAIETALENTLSRNGTSPNSMAADLDMDNNDILNVDNIDVNTLTINGSPIFPKDLITTNPNAFLAIIGGSDAGIDGFKFDFDTFALMKADILRTYSNTTTGDYIRTRAEGFSYQVAASGASDHDEVTAGGLKLYGKGASDLRKYANVRGAINFFDFLDGYSAADRESIAAGTYSGDLATPWTAFRDALAAVDTAGGRPYGVIPECKIFSSVAPNFAMDYLTLETQGHVRIEAIGAVPGFVIDGMGLGVGGFGVRSLNIGPLCASTVTGTRGIYVRRAHMSEFSGFQSLGGAFAGIQVDGCVTSNFRKPLVSPQAEAFIVTPAVGLYVSGSSGGAGVEPWRALIQTSWCKFDLPIIEYTPVGIQFDETYGNTVLGGTAEGCSNTGMILGAPATYNKIIGIDLEANTTLDLDVQGWLNEFYGVDSQGEVLFQLGSCAGNRIFGGTWNELTFTVDTKRNVMHGSSVNTITDNSTGDGRNRFKDIDVRTGSPYGGNWLDRWLTWTPAVTASSGTITTASASGEYKIRDGDTVDFHVRISITTNGTGAGTVRVDLPFATATDMAFSGVELGLSGKSLGGLVGATGTQTDIRFADGTYPGASGAILVISGTYRKV